MSFALRSGLYHHIDCSPRYLNEREIGDALAPILRDGLLRREQLFVVSKLWNSNHRPENVRPALLRTLQSLQLEYLDLYLMHWPVALRRKDFSEATGDCAVSAELADRWQCDAGCCDGADVASLTATWMAMEALQREGLVRAIGVSNFGSSLLKRLLDAKHANCRAIVSIRPAVNQVESHPYLPQTRLLKYCSAQGIQLVAYSPLGSPGNAAVRLKSKSGAAAAPLLVKHPLVLRIAQGVRKTAAQVLLRWQLQRGVIPIPKSTHEVRMRENAGLWGWALSDAHMAGLASLGHENHVRYVPGNAAWRSAPVVPGGRFEALWEDDDN